MDGNPTRLSGMFYDTHHTLRDEWLHVHVSSLSVPEAQGHVNYVRQNYGENSNEWRIRVMGEFPTQESQSVFNLELIEASYDRKVDVRPVQRIWGLDIARFGDDDSALVKRRGNSIEGMDRWQGLSITETAGRVVAEYEDTPPKLRPYRICADVIGVGAGVVDILREQGLPVLAVNVAESPANKDRFQRLRDELYWKGRTWFETRESVLDQEMEHIETLVAELIAPTYSYHANGRIVVEGKEDVKKRLRRSPDMADAFLLTFAIRDMLDDDDDENKMDRYARGRANRRSRGRSHMSR